MNRYEQIKNFSIDDLAWFIQTLLQTTEDNMLQKLSEYGVEVSVVSLEPSVRHASILADLLKEVDVNASDT